MDLIYERHLHFTAPFSRQLSLHSRARVSYTEVVLRPWRVLINRLCDFVTGEPSDTSGLPPFQFILLLLLLLLLLSAQFIQGFSPGHKVQVLKIKAEYTGPSLSKKTSLGLRGYRA